MLNLSIFSTKYSTYGFILIFLILMIKDSAKTLIHDLVAFCSILILLEPRRVKSSHIKRRLATQMNDLCFGWVSYVGGKSTSHFASDAFSGSSKSSGRGK